MSQSLLLRYADNQPHALQGSGPITAARRALNLFLTPHLSVIRNGTLASQPQVDIEDDYCTTVYDMAAWVDG